MSLSLAWVTPFGPASDISAFSLNLLREFHRVAESLDASITVFVNENGATYWTPLPTVMLSRTETDVEMLLGFDFVVFNIGNNTANHGHINRLALRVPAVVIVHDLVMHGALAALLGMSATPGEERRDIYTLLVGDRYGARGLDAVAQSRLCTADASSPYMPWDSSEVAELPLIEPFVESCAALVVHSAYAERSLRLPPETKLLRLALPWDQKPSLSAAEWDEWRHATTVTRRCAIVCIGYIGRTKCLDRVILAFAGSEKLRRCATLLIAGYPDDGAHLAELQHMVAQFDLQDCVSFELSASVDRLRDIKVAADMFVNLRHPNTESASGSLTEQLNAGKPVVVYPSGAYADVDADAVIRVDGHAGVAALMATLEAMVDDPQSRIRIGAAGRAHVRRIGREEYVTRLWAFLCANRQTLRARKACAAARCAVPDIAPGMVGTQWLAGLNRARRPFAGLAGSDLTLEILPFQAWDDDTLAMHIAIGVFGREAGSPLESMLRAGLPGADRVDWYEATAQAQLVWRLVQNPRLAGAHHAMDAPILLPRAWQLLASLGRWNFVCCCYVGLLGRHAQAAEIGCRLTTAATGAPQELIATFLDSDEFRARPQAPEAVRALRDAIAGMDMPSEQCELLLLGEAISFTSANPHSVDYLAPTWHRTEHDGTWSRTSDPILLFRSSTPAEHLTLTVIGRLIGRADTDRTVHVYVDGRLRLAQTGTAMEWLTLVVPVEQPSGKASAHDIRFDCEYTLAPCDIALGDDGRQVAFGLHSIRLTDAAVQEILS